MRFIIVFALFIIQIASQAKVWESTRPWTLQDLEQYSIWIEDIVDKDIFSNPSSPYYGIKTDCADAVFALVIIYSFENGLYYDAKFSGVIIDNKTSKFDDFQDSEKLKTFIEYIGSSGGTYALAKYNSSSFKLKNLRAGDIYISSSEKSNHAAIVKSILPTGHLRLYSSTTPALVRPLAETEGHPSHLTTDAPWGFKRPMPYHLISAFELTEDHSLEQYQLVLKLKDKFFSYVTDQLATEQDTIAKSINRRIGNICKMINARKFAVDTALEKIQERGGKCLTGGQIDLYSTPTRDGNIKIAFYRLMNGWKKIRKMTPDLDSNDLITLEYILGKNTSVQARNTTYQQCPILIQGNPLTLRDYFLAIYNSTLSSHPNHDELSRWGMARPYSTCQN